MTDFAEHSAQPTIAAPVDRAVVVAPTTNTDWPAILAGAAITSAISVVLSAFGSAIGLSLASPYDGASPATHYVALTLWVLWVTILSFAAGGYVCGRLRHRSGDVTKEEVDMRDGAHGLVLWAISTLLFIAVVGTSLYQVARTGAQTGAALVAQNALQQNRTGGQDSSSLLGAPIDRRVDELLRGDVAAGLAPMNSMEDGSRQIVSRILARGLVSGEVSNEDRAYLAQVVQSRSALTGVEAQRRVDTVVENVRQDHERAKAAVEQARKLGVMLSFIAAAAMLIGASSAWGGAVYGGNHRDENVGFGFITRW